MIDTTEAFLAQLAKRGNEPRLHNVSGTIRWDIEDTGNWFVAIHNGSLAVSSETAGADCVFACSREDFDRIVVGKQNPTTLFMQGRMKITGNLGLAQIFQRLFPDESLTSGEEVQA